MSNVPRLLQPYDQWIIDNEGHVAGVQLTDSAKPTLFRNIAPYYGTFLDLTNQTALANTATATKFGTEQIASGVSVVDDTKIVVDRDGVYNIQFSAMFDNPGSTEYDVSVWLDVNGSSVAGSNTDLTVPKKHGSINGHAVASWNFFVQLSASDYVRLMWSTPMATVFIAYQAAQVDPARPTTPSVILTVNQVN